MWFSPPHSGRPGQRSLDTGPNQECATSPLLSIGAFSPSDTHWSKLRIFLRGQLNRLELPVDKPPHRALSISLDSHQQTRRPGCGFVMWIGPGLQMFNHPFPAGWRIHRLKAGGEWFDVASPAQRQHVIPAQQRFKRAPDFGPKFNLPGDGSFHRLAREPGRPAAVRLKP